MPKDKCKLTSLLCLQELPEADATAERHPHPAAELCRLPQAQELAVVATLHQSQASPSGQLASYLLASSTSVLGTKFLIRYSLPLLVSNGHLWKVRVRLYR